MPMTDHFDRLADKAQLGRDPASVRRRIEHMEHLLEGLFTVPVLNRKIGLDVILDVLPVAGDAVAAALGAWIVWEARNLGMSKWQMTRMMGNVGVDFALGLIPWVGAIPDFFFRSNTMNLKMIKRHLDRHYPESAIVEGEVVKR
ncbi:DUF4112 domain-containing protein [Nostoc sp. 3335mG]|nr:DUF4112 domain-containing protein [Nostoc sp. 3335mG]